MALHPHRFQAELGTALVQQAQHGTFAMGARQGTHAHIHGAGADAQADAAILRQALLGNVEFGHDLQARDQRRMQRAVGLHHITQRAVDAKTHGRVALVGFNMDVTGTITGGLRQQGVEHADDGRVVGSFQQVFNGRQGLHHARKIDVAFHFAHYGRGARLTLGIGGADTLAQDFQGFHLDVLHRVLAHDFAHRAG